MGTVTRVSSLVKERRVGTSFTSNLSWTLEHEAGLIKGILFIIHFLLVHVISIANIVSPSIQKLCNNPEYKYIDKYIYKDTKRFLTNEGISLENGRSRLNTEREDKNCDTNTLGSSSKRYSLQEKSPL